MLTRRSLSDPRRGMRWDPFAHNLSAVAAEAKRVRITDVESFRVRIPGGDAREEMKVYSYGVSRVHTDAGVTGTSFVPCPNDILQRWVKPVLVGAGPLRCRPARRTAPGIARRIRRTDLVRRRARDVGRNRTDRKPARSEAARRSPGPPPRVSNHCLALHTAGRSAKKPLLETDQAEVPYETQAKFAVRLRENGFTGMKIRAWRPKPMDDVDAVGAIRAAVGPDFKIMLDRTAVRPGSVWDYPTALQVCRGLEKHNAYWLEEPFDGHDIFGPARLAAEVDILITGGELAKSTYEFHGVSGQQDLRRGAARYPHLRRNLDGAEDCCSGRTFGVPCIQHGTSSLALAGYIQAGCAMGNCEWQEIIGGPNLPQEQWEPAKKLVRTPDVFRIENGFVLLPDLPGLGLDLNEDAIREYRQQCVICRGEDFFGTIAAAGTLERVWAAVKPVRITGVDIFPIRIPVDGRRGEGRLHGPVHSLQGQHRCRRHRVLICRPAATRCRRSNRFSKAKTCSTSTRCSGKAYGAGVEWSTPCGTHRKDCGSARLQAAGRCRGSG